MQSIDISNLTKEELVHLFRTTHMHKCISTKDVAWTRYELKSLKAKAACDVARIEMDKNKRQENWDEYHKAMRDMDKGFELYKEADELFKTWERIGF